MTQSSENGTGACLVFLTWFRGKNVLSRGQGLMDRSGLAGGWPWRSCFLFTTRARCPLDCTESLPCPTSGHLRPPDSGLGGLQGAAGAGCSVRAVVVTSPRPQSSLPCPLNRYRRHLALLSGTSGELCHGGMFGSLEFAPSCGRCRERVSLAPIFIPVWTRPDGKAAGGSQGGAQGLCPP